MKTSKRSSSRVECKEKIYESDSSVECAWESDDESDWPSLKAISMTSLDIADCLESEPLRVRFSADIDCQTCLHISDYTGQEADVCFYTEEERATMSASREDIIAKINDGINDEQQEELIRGLEYWCVSSSTEINRRVDAMIEKIMDEQDDQIDGNILDNHALAIAAQDVTIESAEVAQQNAAKDALIAREAYLQMGSRLPKSFPSIDKERSKRRKAKDKSATDMDTAALAVVADEDERKPKKEKKEKKTSSGKKDKKDKSGKKTKRTSSIIYKERQEAKLKASQNKPRFDSDMEKPKSDKSDDFLVTSEKSSKKPSCSKKKSDKALKKQPSSRKIEAKRGGSDRTIVTESETSIGSAEGTVVKHSTESSLSSDEGEIFLQESERQSKNPSRKITERHTLPEPPSRKAIPEVGDDDDKDDNSRLLTRSFSWWNL